jgi:endonuclease/exonuclease/phosphatase family metal-dependent hydrolase
MGRREQVLRAAAALLVVAVLVALVIRDRSGSDDTATPEVPDRVVTTPDGEPDPTATEPTDVVPSPPEGLEALVCEQFNKPVKLRVLSFNTHRSTGSLASIVQEILELQPDIALLQEVDRRMVRSGGVDQADLLADAVGMNGSFSRNLVRGSGTYGTLILSRFDVLQEGRVPLVRTARGEPRGLQWALVDISGQAVRLYNTHLDARRPSVRLRQARQVADIVREDEAPLILGGDLNAWPGSPAVGALSRVLTETWAVAGQGRAATGRGGHKIDYLFVNGLRPLRSQVATSLVSDHDRLWADLRLASPEKCGN